MADHPAPPRPLVEGPSAWIGADLARRPEEWTYQLTATDLAEIAAATKANLGRDIASITRADFPLPTFGLVLDRLRGELLHGRGFVLLRGLPVEGRPIEASAIAYLGSALISAPPALRTPKGTSSAMCAIWAGDRRPERPDLSNDRAAAFPYRFLRYSRLAVPEDIEGRRAVVSGVVEFDLQRDGRALSAPGRAFVPTVLGRSARRGSRRQETLVRHAGVPRLSRLFVGDLFRSVYPFRATLPRSGKADRVRLRHPGRVRFAGRGQGPTPGHHLSARRHAVRA